MRILGIQRRYMSETCSRICQLRCNSASRTHFRVETTDQIMLQLDLQLGLSFRVAAALAPPLQLEPFLELLGCNRRPCSWPLLRCWTLIMIVFHLTKCMYDITLITWGSRENGSLPRRLLFVGHVSPAQLRQGALQRLTSFPVFWNVGTA